VALAAGELGLPLLTPERARNPEFIAQIELLRPDLLVVASYGQILRPRLLAAGKHGAINLHGSLLPRWRGAAPIQRAIEAGDEVTGVTLMQMDAGMDTGPLIDAVTTDIGPDETYGELQNRLADLSADLLGEWWERLRQGAFSALPQTEIGACLAPKIEPSEREVHVAESAWTAARRVRALTPTPGAAMTVAGRRVALVKVEPVESPAQSGTVVSVKPLVLAMGEGALVLHRIRPEGKTEMSGTDWANGARLAPEMRWDDTSA
jgi:methionyl-tRNA formyltransferase